MIAVIGILVAGAAPSFVRYLRDRRVSDAAHNIAELYRTARTRAMGRGSATRVVYDGSAALPTDADPGGMFEIFESVAGPTDPFNQTLPVSSCVTANLNYIRGFEPRRNRYQPNAIRFLDNNGSPLGFTSICYTPRGRTFFANANNGGFLPLTFVAQVEVTNTETGQQRIVIIPPNGAARIEARGTQL